MQTLVLANLVHLPHSQISMRILPLIWFHKFVEKGLVVVNAQLMSSSGWIWFRCLVLKIVISLKNSLTTVCSWKTKKSFCFLPIQIRAIWFTQKVQLSTLQLSQLFSNAPHFTMNLRHWCLKGTSHPVKCFDVIVRSDIPFELGDVC